MKRTELLTLGFMMFSVFFGAGNLIFPPALGQIAGDHAPMAMAGFMTTGVGLPLMGIIAIALSGGAYTALIRQRTAPWFATALLVILYLIIGPIFAMPRTGAVSFEIGIRPFLSDDWLLIGQILYTVVFFGLSYYLALNPSKIIDRVGNLLTPALLLFLAVLFVRAFWSPLGPVIASGGAYVAAPYAQGFQDGYQTMDLLASVAIGALVVNAVRMRGITDKKQISIACLVAGGITVVLMALVYGSLAYIGATSAIPLGHSANGGQLLADAVRLFFGQTGNLLLAIIIALACLTTCCGVTSSAAMFFNKLLKNRISYERLLLISTIFSFLASNIGLTGLIRLALPFLVAIYPVVIVFVLLSLFDSFIGQRKTIYQGAIGLTFIFSIIDAFHEAGLVAVEPLRNVLVNYLPLYGVMLGWVCPAVIGACLGFAVSLLRKKPALNEAKEV